MDTRNNTVLVTGANSMLGSHTVISLLSAGYGIRALVRKGKKHEVEETVKDFMKTNNHARPHIEIMEGNFTSARDAAEAVKGCKFVIHVAACTDQGGRDYGHYRKINVEATLQLAALAENAGVSRFIFISSANCFAFGTKTAPGDESQHIRKPFSKSHYAASKFEAQTRFLTGTENCGGYSHGKAQKMERIALCPTFMLGPYDRKPSSGQIIIMAYSRRIMPCPPGGKSFVHVADVAAGAVSSLTHGRDGEAYLLSGENLSYREFYRLLSSLCARPKMLLPLPTPLCKLVGLCGSLLRIFGLRTDLSFSNMSILCIGNYYTCRKAQAELGFRPRPALLAIEDALDWFYGTAVSH